MGCCEVGIGRKGLFTFCNIMNIPEPMNYLGYENIKANFILLTLKLPENQCSK